MLHKCRDALNWNYCNPKLTRRNISTVKTWRFSHCQRSTISDTAKTLRSNTCPSTAFGFPNITPAHHAVPWHLDHWNHRPWLAPAQKKQLRNDGPLTAAWLTNAWHKKNIKHQTTAFGGAIWFFHLIVHLPSPLWPKSGTVQHFWALQKKFSRKIARVYWPWWEFAWFCLCYRIAIFHLMMFGVVLQLPLLFLNWGSKHLKTCWMTCYVFCQF